MVPVSPLRPPLAEAQEKAELKIPALDLRGHPERQWSHDEQFGS
jgi:hypothetical protein